MIRGGLQTKKCAHCLVLDSIHTRHLTGDKQHAAVHCTHKDRLHDGPRSLQLLGGKKEQCDMSGLNRLEAVMGGYVRDGTIFSASYASNAVITSARGFQMASVHLVFFGAFVVEHAFSTRRLKCLHR